jgi:hypothetical protein
MSHPFRIKRARLFVVGISAALLVLGALLLGSRGAHAAGGTVPADGKYRNVTVEGRTVPMIHVKEGGTIVLVDTDGKEPRTWEEMFKRHGDLPNGTFNVHKTAPNGTDDFANVPIDRKGTWTIDPSGNITAH